MGPHDPWKNNDAYYSPLEAFALLGPSIRECFRAHGNCKTAQGPAHDFQKFLRPDDVFDRVDDFVTALKTETVVTAPRPGLTFHRFFVVSRPYDSSNPMPSDVLFHHAIPTRFLHRLLWTHFHRRTTEKQVALIAKLARAPQPEGMSFVYEPTILDALCAPGTGGPSATCHLADGPAFTLGPGLVLAGDEVDGDTPSVVPRDNHVYLLRSGGGFPGIDAFVVSEGRTRVTMLQTTVNYRREVVSAAVGRVVRLVQRSMPNTSAEIKWSFVFVGPGGRGEAAAKTLREVRFRGRLPAVVAGWLESGALLAFPEEVVVRTAVAVCRGSVRGAS